MDDNVEIVLSSKQQLTDQVAVTVLGGIAALFTHKLVEKGYKAAITAYRVKKATA